MKSKALLPALLCGAIGAAACSASTPTARTTLSSASVASPSPALSPSPVPLDPVGTRNAVESLVEDQLRDALPDVVVGADIIPLDLYGDVLVIELYDLRARDDAAAVWLAVGRAVETHAEDLLSNDWGYVGWGSVDLESLANGIPTIASVVKVENWVAYVTGEITGAEFREEINTEFLPLSD